MLCVRQGLWTRKVKSEKCCFVAQRALGLWCISYNMTILVYLMHKVQIRRLCEGPVRALCTSERDKLPILSLQLPSFDPDYGPKP